MSDSVKKVALITLGCPKNEVDSEVLAGELHRQGLLLVEDAQEADAVLINTCGFIEAAKAESIETILTAVELKKADPSKRIAVWGCLSERYKDEIDREIPEVDAYFGVEPFEALGQWVIGENYRVSPKAHEGRALSTPPHTAYLKIADGCDHKCTFCAIPGIKGAYRSRPQAALLEEAAALVAGGVKELILIAQDTSLYGRDLPGDANLVSLLKALAVLEGLEWIRIMYVHPLHVSDDLVALIAEEPKIVKYIDMPLQHIADSVLRRMGRGHDRKRVIDLLSRMKEQIPSLVLRTAFIVGFPGESDEDFETLLDFVEETRFHRLGAFVYSAEEGTPAASLESPVDARVAQMRYDRLISAQYDITEELNASLVGSTLPVIIDGFDEEEGLHYGRTQGDGLDIDQLVWVDGSPPVGEIVTVTIDDASAYDLYGSWTG